MAAQQLSWDVVVDRHGDKEVYTTDLPGRQRLTGGFRCIHSLARECPAGGYSQDENLHACGRAMSDGDVLQTPPRDLLGGSAAKRSGDLESPGKFSSLELHLFHLHPPPSPSLLSFPSPVDLCSGSPGPGSLSPSSFSRVSHLLFLPVHSPAFRHHDAASPLQDLRPVVRCQADSFLLQTCGREPAAAEICSQGTSTASGSLMATGSKATPRAYVNASANRLTAL